jgi:hypothetical protein
VAPLPVTLIPKPYNCLYSLRQSRRLSGRVRRLQPIVPDIYENSFGRPPTLSGSWNAPRGRFYRFLERGLPPSFLRHGKLSLRHVKRTLARRKKPIKIVLTIGGPVEHTPAPATDSMRASDHEPAQPSQASP